MTLNLKENTWLKWSLISLAIVTAIVLWLSLSGGIFLTAYKRKFEDATPLTVYQYWYYYGADKQVQKWLAIACGISFAMVVAPLFMLISPVKRSLFGAARFANRSDIKKAGLYSDEGIIVGKYRNKFLMFSGQRHPLMSAPTRSGKGVGIVVPNLLNWPHSVVTTDMKLENWLLTSGYRKRYGQECYLFNPMNKGYKSHRYNPLHYISSDPNFRIDDIQKIAHMLFPDKVGTDIIWTATPRSLFLGVVLFLIETPGKLVTLGQALRETLNDGDGSAYFAKAINDRAAAGKPYSGACVRALNSYIAIASENTRSGVMTSFRASLELWMNPLVDAATSANDFDLRQVREKRMSIYLGVTPDNLTQMAPLLNLFFQQLVDLNTRELPSQNTKIKFPCLLLMDEFAALGKVSIIVKGISYVAGYWLRIMPIIQSPAQLVDVYGKEAAQNFTTNHALSIVFPPKASETQTARDISEWLGYQTVKGTSESKGKGLFSKKQESTSTSDQKRALMLPQEITGLGQDKELIILEDTPPILAEKIFFFKDRVFVDRLKEISASLRKLGKEFPTQKQLEAIMESGELACPVPAIDVAAHLSSLDQPASVVTVTVPGKATGQMKIIERPVVASDIPNIDKTTLDKYAIDWSTVEKPTPSKMDHAALLKHADERCKAAGIEP